MDPPPPPAVPSAASAAPPEESKKRPASDEKEEQQPKKKPASALQQQIQQQLQEQLQQQLQAAAARGQQANITPEQIQAQAAAMVQAAAQAQAVVAAAKTRNWQPMNASQITALSQIQATAIVQARKLPSSQVATQVQIQTQALIHAHTQAQIQAGIYKGDDTKDAKQSAVASPATNAAVGAPELSPSQQQELQELRRELEMEKARVPESQRSSLNAIHETKIQQKLEEYRKLNEDMQDSSSPEFQQQLAGSLQAFWRKASSEITALENQTEQDFKNHNDLPLARIKRIMKSDEDVRMISAEAPVLFAKACELFILDLSIRSWNYAVLHRRRTLQKEDVKESIQKTDIFDFLVDVIQ